MRGFFTTATIYSIDTRNVDKTRRNSIDDARVILSFRLVARGARNGTTETAVFLTSSRHGQDVSTIFPRKQGRFAISKYPPTLTDELISLESNHVG